MTKSLAELRVKIDSIDTELLELLNQRAQIAHEVGLLKKVDGSPVFRPDREKQVIERVQTNSQGPLKSESLGFIWLEIMSACRALELIQRVAFLGPVGTYSEQAAISFFGSSMEFLPCNTIDEVFRSTASGSSDFGVIAIENSNEGVVSRSLDLLLHSPLHLVGETSFLIHHNLMRSINISQGIEVIYAHPQALAQCQEWLTINYPQAERRAATSNAEGARLAATNSAWAAIAGERAASQFGLHIVNKSIQDDPLNRTRFVIACLPETLPTPPASGNDCVSLIVSVNNKPGAVHDLLIPLKKHGVSMSRFESRPARSGQWEYFFYIDLHGHISDPSVNAALTELQDYCTFYKVLGSYPIGG